MSQESLCASCMRCRFFLPCAYRPEINIVEFFRSFMQFPATLTLHYNLQISFTLQMPIIIIVSLFCPLISFPFFGFNVEPYYLYVFLFLFKNLLLC